MINFSEILGMKKVSEFEEIKNNFMDRLLKFNFLSSKNAGASISWNELKEIFSKKGLNIDHIYYDERLFFTQQFIFVYRNFPFEFPYGDMNSVVKCLCSLKDKVDSYWDDKSLCLSTLLIRVVNPYKVMFINFYYDIFNEDKYEVVRSLYTRLEYGFQNIDSEIIEEIFSLTEEDKVLLKRYVDKKGYLIIYRGEGSESTCVEEAYSWSLSKDIAIWFANRFDSENDLKSVYEAKIHIDDVKDFFDNKEQEVIVDYSYLIDIKKIDF